MPSDLCVEVLQSRNHRTSLSGLLVIHWIYRQLYFVSFFFSIRLHTNFHTYSSVLRNNISAMYLPFYRIISQTKHKTLLLHVNYHVSCFSYKQLGCFSFCILTNNFFVFLVPSIMFCCLYWRRHDLMK